MMTVVIANPAARAGKVGRQWGQLEATVERALGPIEVRLTGHPGEATQLARRAIQDGAERIAVVGGDGTLNEVVNGFFAENGQLLGREVVLALVPVGTGGDFSRSIGLCGVELATAIERATVHRIDLGRAEMVARDGSPVLRHFVNISSFGSSGLIVDMVNNTSKLLGAKASFMWGTLKGLLQYRNQRIRLQVDDVCDEEMVVNTVAVANGRFFGGSMKIAPQAVLDDGLFDITVVGDIGLAEFLGANRRLYQGDILGVPGVRRLVGREIKATPIGHAQVLIDLDGEQPGQLPVTYRILPAALQLLAPWGQAEAGKPANPRENAS